MNLTSMAQCNCPDTNNCAPCNGNITYLKLRYLGNLPYILVSVADGSEFLEFSIERPGEEIAFTGSLPQGAFAGNRARIFINGFFHVMLDTRCDAGIFVGEKFGDFVIIEAASRNNGPICCNGQAADSEAPVLTSCPADIDVTASSGACSRTVSWIPPEVSDNCDVVPLSSTHQPGNTFPVGKTVVMYTATDEDGNTTRCSFNVTVSESTSPIINGCPSSMAVSADESCQATVYWSPPFTSDNCSGVILSSTHEPGNTFEAGITTVTYTATDASGNVAKCAFDVEVKTPDVIISDCPGNFTVDADLTGLTSVTWKEPDFPGYCPGLTFSASHSPPSLLDVGDTKVTYTASSGDSVFSICSFTISVIRYEIVVHEVLTPNGDGANDVWIIQNIDNYNDNLVMVFDRWGSEIFRADGYNNESVSWDGGAFPTGTYFYRITARKSKKTFNKTGYIELVR